MEADVQQQFYIENVPVDVLSTNGAVDVICDDAGKSDPFSVYTINLDHVVKLRRDQAFRTAYRKARYVLADGFPIALAGRLRGLDVKRTTGSDLIEPLCREAAKRGLPVVFYGSTFASLTCAARELVRRVPDLDVAGAYAPGLVDPASSAEPDGMEFIRQSGAKICFLALGAPKQELLAARFADDFKDGMAMICIGAGLDFLAGVQTRAPKFVRAIGCEWLWRLGTDPVRMTSRYVDCFTVLPSVLMAGWKR